jgi:hypothetical protein
MDKRILGLALALGAAPLAAACTPLGTAVGETVLNGVNASVVQGEVRSVSTRQGRIQLRDGSGRNHDIRFDRQTQVVHRQRQVAISTLERGDRVRVRVQRDRNGTVWADRVEVQTSARESRQAVRTERVEGRVGRVDVRRGTFTVERNRTATLVIRTPPHLDRSDARRFERLREGDRVRAEVRPLGRNQAELVRFR